GHKPRFFPWEGADRLTMGIDFLKAVNRGETPKVGKNVIVIGCGNSGMDTVVGAYQMGAENVIAVDVQKPAAFAKEIKHVEDLGGTLVWPFMTNKITDKGIYDKEGRFIAGDQVIVSIGEAPILDYLPQNDSIKKFRDWLVPKDDKSILDGVFVAGDVIKPGRLVDAIGDGIKAAHFADEYVLGNEAMPMAEKQEIPADRIVKAYFDKCHHCNLAEPIEDHNRCISCGTCRDCKMCIESCPEKAISRVEYEDGTYEYVSDPDKCIGCGICAGICPCGIWSINNNPEPIKMYRTYK
ncbi:MAG: 4Fe-4S dicluster domain-containing protein, partial [Selenomonadaceae bacterium]